MAGGNAGVAARVRGRELKPFGASTQECECFMLQPACAGAN